MSSKKIKDYVLGITGFFLVIVIFIISLPYIQDIGVIDATTSDYLSSTGDAVSSGLPLFAILIISGLSISIWATRGRGR